MQQLLPHPRLKVVIVPVAADVQALQQYVELVQHEFCRRSGVNRRAGVRVADAGQRRAAGGDGSMDGRIVAPVLPSPEQQLEELWIDKGQPNFDSLTKQFQ